MDSKILSMLRSAGIYIFMGFITWSCASDELGAPPIPEPPEMEFIGSAACATCHTDIYNSFLTTGHPYKLSEVAGGSAPEYPYTTLDHLPSGYTWNDMSYVIGGYFWKAQYVDSNGYIVTGDDTQWNFETEEAVAYHPGEAPGTKMYDCGRCHTTGWVSVADGGNPQNDLEGMGGSFFSGGIQCEQCHGMGSLHEFSRSKDDINIDASAQFCGTCHNRNSDATISAMDGFILNYQQYSEMSAAGHQSLSCVDCHNPHKTTKHGQTGGIIKDCLDCHSDIENGRNHRGVADCVTCHMPYASKSAVARTAYQADLMTHIFKINTDADGKMFNEEGTIADGSSGVTLDLVCYSCHKDPNGEGGSPEFPATSIKTLEELSAYAEGYHD
jgi:hypothetical protein